MTDMDYRRSLDFIDPADGKRRKMRFRFDEPNVMPRKSARTIGGIGQLIAVVDEAYNPENGDEIAISRPGVLFDEVEAAIEGWENWATRYVGPGTKRAADLALIRDRIRAAGLT